MASMPIVYVYTSSNRGPLPDLTLKEGDVFVSAAGLEFRLSDYDGVKDMWTYDVRDGSGWRKSFYTVGASSLRDGILKGEYIRKSSLEKAESLRGKKCVCGAHSCKSNIHSAWCDLYEA
jgi:hypothetical protein